jgi:hypothetical protein
LAANCQKHFIVQIARKKVIVVRCWISFFVVNRVNGLSGVCRPRAEPAKPASKATAAMAEQKAEIDNSAPFASVKSSGSPAHASHSHHHHPPTFSANNHGYVGHQAPHLFPQNAEVLLL